MYLQTSQQLAVLQHLLGVHKHSSVFNFAALTLTQTTSSKLCVFLGWPEMRYLFGAVHLPE